jgi:hypothetical protein
LLPVSGTLYLPVTVAKDIKGTTAVGIPRFLKPFDWVIVSLGLALTIGSVFWAYAGAGTRSSILIQGAEDRWVYPLDAEALVRVPGPLGDTVVEIRAGGARVRSSPCANQTCLSARAVHRHGEWLACLPNGVLVRVESAPHTGGEASGEGGIDAASW